MTTLGIDDGLATRWHTLNILHEVLLRDFMLLSCQILTNPLFDLRNALANAIFQ